MEMTSNYMKMEMKLNLETLNEISF